MKKLEYLIESNSCYILAAIILTHKQHTDTFNWVISALFIIFGTYLSFLAHNEND